jgi:hypothetical protein
MTDKEILKAIRTIFIERMQIHPRYKGLNAKLLWKAIEPKISIPYLRTHFQKEQAVKTIQAETSNVSPVGFEGIINLLQKNPQISRRDGKEIVHILSESINKAFSKRNSSYNMVNSILAKHRVINGASVTSAEGKYLRLLSGFLKDIAVQILG